MPLRECLEFDERCFLLQLAHNQGQGCQTYASLWGCTQAAYLQLIACLVLARSPPCVCLLVAARVMVCDMIP